MAPSHKGTTVLKGGTIVDGSGRPGFVADLAFADGRITAIGADLTGDAEIDVSGLIVAPGFIDIHKCSGIPH